MRGRKAQAGSRQVVCSAGLDARGLQIGQDGFEQRQKALACRRERRGMGTAVEQLHAHPVFQGADMAAEGGLGNGAGLRRAREIARLGQGEEILQPFQVQGSVAGSHVSPRWIGR